MDKPSSNYWWPYNSPVTIHGQIYDQQNSIWLKALILPLTIRDCVLSYKEKNYFSKNWLVLP